MSPGEFASLVRRSVEEDKARVIVIDSLNGYLNAMPDGRFLILQMHELLSYLNQQGVLTILVLAQHGLVGPMDTPLDVSYLERRGDHAALLRVRRRGAPRALGGEEAQRRPRAFDPRVPADRQRAYPSGPPLTEFSGIFSGTPRYTGDSAPLLPSKPAGND